MSIVILITVVAVIAIVAIASTILTSARDGYRRLPDRHPELHRR